MNKKITCEDCYYSCTCPERRGICTSFKRKRKSGATEKLMMIIWIIAFTMFFLFALYAASVGTVISLIVGLIGMAPTGYISIYIPNNISYDEG